MASNSLESFAPGDLALYHRNPRLGNVSIIEGSLRAHGQYRPVVVNRGTFTGRANEVLAGNHTVKAFRNLQATEPDDPRWRSIDAYVIDVDDDKAARIVLVDNRSAEVGGFDQEVLADLLDGLPGLDGTGYTDADLAELLTGLDVGDGGDGESGEREERYTGTVNIPQYEPTGECPPVSALMDTTRTRELCERIEAADVPDEVADFLMAAASRHTVIDFRAVAEFYAHAEPEVQRLMEDSALVIIDVNDAIAKGYATLRSELQAMFDTEYAAQKAADVEGAA
jgi:hypothetical protein